MEQTAKNPVQGIRNTITYLKRPRSQVLAAKPLQLQQSLVQHDHDQGQGQPTSQSHLADQLVDVSASVLPLEDHAALSLTKQVSSKQDQDQFWQPIIELNAEPAAVNKSLGQHNHGHDHNLYDHSQYLDADSDQEQNPDLEAPMNTTGTVWADVDIDNIAVDTGDMTDTVDDTFYCDASGEPVWG